MENPEKISTSLDSDASVKEAVIWLGELAIIHTSGKDTEGRYTMIELYATKEGEPPWHVHHGVDEAFYILDGEMTVYVGNKAMKGKPGDVIFAPKDVPHTYTVDSPGHARVLLIFSPAGFEDFVRATSVLATSHFPPPPENVNIDYDEVMKLAMQFGTEFVEPPANMNLQ
jgi:quercetin dioxygenase-like cupin family protein